MVRKAAAQPIDAIDRPCLRRYSRRRKPPGCKPPDFVPVQGRHAHVVKLAAEGGAGAAHHAAQRGRGRARKYVRRRFLRLYDAAHRAQEGRPPPTPARPGTRRSSRRTADRRRRQECSDRPAHTRPGHPRRPRAQGAWRRIAHTRRPTSRCPPSCRQSPAARRRQLALPFRAAPCRAPCGRARPRPPSCTGLQTAACRECPPRWRSPAPRPARSQAGWPRWGASTTCPRARVREQHAANGAAPRAGRKDVDPARRAAAPRKIFAAGGNAACKRRMPSAAAPVRAPGCGGCALARAPPARHCAFSCAPRRALASYIYTFAYRAGA